MTEHITHETVGLVDREYKLRNISNILCKQHQKDTCFEIMSPKSISTAVKIESHIVLAVLHFIWIFRNK
jgi:hypothetical protein